MGHKGAELLAVARHQLITGALSRSGGEIDCGSSSWLRFSNWRCEPSTEVESTLGAAEQ
jgi:hypothetical protein